MENRPACAGNTGKLIDPSIDIVSMQPRGLITSLEKPSIGQAYTVNSDAALAAHPADLAPSNPDDYYQDRQMAMVLGKALFWDSQVGSDGVQACASCHFSAGADTRVRDQLNPNTLGGDSLLEVFRNRHPGTPATPADQDVNTDLVGERLPDPQTEKPGDRRRAAAQSVATCRATPTTWFRRWAFACASSRTSA